MTPEKRIPNEDFDTPTPDSMENRDLLQKTAEELEAEAYPIFLNPRYTEDIRKALDTDSSMRAHYSTAKMELSKIMDPNVPMTRLRVLRKMYYTMTEHGMSKELLELVIFCRNFKKNKM